MTMLILASASGIRARLLREAGHAPEARSALRAARLLVRGARPPR